MINFELFARVISMIRSFGDDLFSDQELIWSEHPDIG